LKRKEMGRSEWKRKKCVGGGDLDIVASERILKISIFSKFRKYTSSVNQFAGLYCMIILVVKIKEETVIWISRPGTLGQPLI
jgi:hypothetical protein